MADHFSHNIHRWNEMILPRYVNKRTRMLIIGANGGRSAHYALTTFLASHEQSSLVCLDNYQSATATKQEFHDRVMTTPQNKNKTILLDGDIPDNLKTLKNNIFDIVYIDSEHSSRHNMEYAVLCFSLLKPQGIMVFHNYTNGHYHHNNCPKPGIDAFLDAYAQEIKVLYVGWELYLMKRSRPLKRVVCKSEYYHEDIALV